MVVLEEEPVILNLPRLDINPISIAQVSVKIVCEFEKKKWSEEYLVWASKNERKANRFAGRVIKLLQRGELKSAYIHICEIQNLDRIRWKTFIKHFEHLIDCLGEI
jgi:hypothetical protein